MVTKGRREAGRARYNPDQRNHWAEEEAGIHYSRAMASHGVFIAACGFEHHGPRGHLGFAPALTPENFRAPFIAAEGWGTYAQMAADGKMSASIEIKQGQLQLQTLHLMMATATGTPTVQASLAGAGIPIAFTHENRRIKLAFVNPLIVIKEQKLAIEVG